MRPITLSEDELQQVIERVAPTGKEYGSARIVRMLAAEHSVQTVRINTKCAVGNISDQVHKLINPRIDDLGLYVACVKPPYPIKNQFGQSSGQMLWSFFKDQAVNDDYYDPQDNLMARLAADVHEMQAQYPLLDMPDDEWVGALQKLDGIK
jgi:hypothetical protein